MSEEIVEVDESGDEGPAMRLLLKLVDVVVDPVGEFKKGLRVLGKGSVREAVAYLSGGHPATRRLSAASEWEGIRGLDPHTEEMAEKVNLIPIEHRRSEVLSLLSAYLEAWKRANGSKKRRVLKAVFLNGLDREALEEGNASSILRIVDSLDYAEIRFLVVEFGDDGCLVGTKPLRSASQTTEASRAEHRFVRMRDPSSQESELLHRLSSLRLIAEQRFHRRGVDVPKRTWLGNELVRFCRHPSFSELYDEQCPGDE